MTNSRRKGKEGELEFARYIRNGWGYDVRRGQQYSGINGDADVVGLPGVHVEVKRVEQLNLKKAMEQSIRDARPGEIPIVAHRRNGEKWQITCSADCFMEMYNGCAALGMLLAEQDDMLEYVCEYMRMFGGDYCETHCGGDTRPARCYENYVITARRKKWKMMRIFRK